MISKPWKVRTISGAAGGITKDAVIHAQIVCKADTVEEIRALLDAAPDLLNALLDCVTTIEELVADCCTHGDDTAKRTIRLAETAIAKALGANHD